MQYELQKVKGLRLIDAWWVDGYVYYVRRSPGSEPTRLGRIDCAEAFLVGCWSTLNGIRRRQGVS